MKIVGIVVDHYDDVVSSPGTNTQSTAPVEVVREPPTDDAESDGARDTSTYHNTVAVVPVRRNTDVPIPQYVDILMFNQVNRAYRMPKRPGERSRVTKIGTGLRSALDPSRPGSVNDHSVPISVPIATAELMAVALTQSAELRRQQKQQRQEEGRQREGEGEEATKYVEVIATGRPDPRGQSIQIVTRRFGAPVSLYDV